ncbi:hypothetical protein Pcar_0373 [Syntrophotalea carbinolica DSM 2380]|uniref:Uncharacterized protein n=1 Tax=Syntrophotalea carbinolica (strain DSM 2380 / NBRC 103641 / GraBd1) TaxID=338963 RepID=Q3A7L1_SYNC1|nr:hypothetical protein [Syntrophotalea carbinolica]ABA87633.1 hypothetical protein Pcar_0373 [Syntrophotalea carbinolica DSM 2380]
MAMSRDNQTRMQAMENLEQIARTYTRHMMGPHFPGHQEEAILLLQKLNSAVKNLDSIEGCELPVGHMHKWQETTSYMQPATKTPR